MLLRGKTNTNLFIVIRKNQNKRSQEVGRGLFLKWEGDEEMKGREDEKSIKTVMHMDQLPQGMQSVGTANMHS